MPDTSRAARWLMAEFEAASHDEIDTDSYDEILGGWSRPVHVYPMIKLKSLMDAGEPMRVTAADYGDPLRRWL